MAALSMVTCKAPVNIALIKYWGKRDEDLILPMAGSVSITLDIEQMCAKTTAAYSTDFEKDRFWLNNVELPLDNPRLLACIREIRKRSASQRKSSGDAGTSTVDGGVEDRHLHICSSNNFPTAAGLASSAAGYACLVATLAKLYNVQGDISKLARLGSGSACRSVLGGFVEWIRGEQDDGSDSLAVQVAPASHWPELRVLVLVVSDRPKAVGSTEGMRRCVDTGEFFHYWANQCVPKQVTRIKLALLAKDFRALADMTMRASNQLHALCLETMPPIAYMTDASHALADLVHALNAERELPVAAYTFDAGPNACLLLPDEAAAARVVAAVLHHFPPPVGETNFLRGLPVVPGEYKTSQFTEVIGVRPGALQYIIHTKLGDGPQQTDSHLLNDQGLPLGLDATKPQ